MAFVNPSSLPTVALQEKLKGEPILVALFFVGFAGQALRNLVDWSGYALITALLVAALIVVNKNVFNKKFVRLQTPAMLVAYLGLAAATIIWSAYRPETLAGVGILFVTFFTGWVVVNSYRIQVIVVSLFHALKWIAILSLLFELWLAVFVKHGILPVPLMGLKAGTYPPSYDWSYGILFQGGPIQGIVGNRNLLGFIALLLIITALGLCFRNYLSWIQGSVWTAVGVGLTVLTASATIEASMFAVFIIFLIVQTLKAVKPVMKYVLYFTLTVCSGVFIILLGTFSSFFFALLDRSPDMTNRFFIWHKVAHLALQRPEGWGWIGYWAPWVYPFKNYVIVDNTVQLHAHNALIDIWLQLGVVGVIIAVCVAVLAAVQAWRHAVREVTGARLDLTVLLLLAALLLQSVAESRLLIEGNWLLFSMLVIYVNRPKIEELTV